MAFRFRCLAGLLLPLILLLAVAYPAESQEQAALEKQLTERVDQVLQLHVSGEWGKVGAFLTEDSQELWLVQRKGKVDSYHLESVEIAPDGKHATVLLKVTFRVPMANNLPFTMLRSTDWVYQEGQWFMKLKRASSMLDTFNLSGNPTFATKAVKAISPLLFDQNPIHLSRPKPGSEVVVKIPYQNVSANIVTVQDLRTNCTCLKAKMDKMEVQPAEKGSLTVTYQASSETTPGRTPTVQAILAPELFLLDIPVVFDTEKPVP